MFDRYFDSPSRFLVFSLAKKTPTITCGHQTLSSHPQSTISIYYMNGLMHGMSWGVVCLPFSQYLPVTCTCWLTSYQIKSLASAPVSQEDIQLYMPEDMRIGQFLLSLPSAPPTSHSSGESHVDDTTRYRYSATNPYAFIPPVKPRTGLLRIDLHGCLANYGRIDSYSGDRAFAWHNLKTDELYKQAWLAARKDQQKKGTDIWLPPLGWEVYAREI